MKSARRSATRPRAVLLDLGNVVLELDPSSTFKRWAAAAQVTPEALARRWAIDEAYRRHEVGEIDFEVYVQHLGERLGIDLPAADWLEGWNALFVAPFEPVIARLSPLAERFDLRCYTNTNAAHEAEWRRRFGALLHPFQHIYVSSTIGRRKPDPASFQWVAADMGIAPGEIVFLDDSSENVVGATVAGLQGLHVPRLEDVVAALDRLLSA